jgi:hypothetical protein
MSSKSMDFILRLGAHCIIRITGQLFRQQSAGNHTLPAENTAQLEQNVARRALAREPQRLDPHSASAYSF